MEALRDGGPRKREGGGALWGWGVDVDAELGERVDIARFELDHELVRW